ncbi:MAG: alpha/beta fold hydrolase [Planctomycetes bacterium]|nr:alpha/beta fold hydrolase [Planctomycetota bacterium]
MHIPHLFAAAGVAWAWSAYSRQRYGVDPAADEVHTIHTPDGWRLALSRYRAQEARLAHPVLLVPGLACNRVAYDLDPERSLARWLAARGVDAWVVELRGHGLSQRPRWGATQRYGYSFDTHATLDLPAAIEGVLARTGAPALHALGHSLGGMLLYAALSRGEARLRSAITVASALDHSEAPSDFHALLGAAPLVELLPATPIGAALRMAAPFGGRLPSNRLEEFNLWPPNVEPEFARRLHASAFHPVSTPVLVQLATAFEPGGLRHADGSTRYLPPLGRASTPVLAFAGTRDRQCSPQAADTTLRAVGSRRRRLETLEDYGHFDLLIGKHAHEAVFPKVLAWLHECD